MPRQIASAIVVALVTSLLVAASAGAKDREKGPKELLAEAKIGANSRAPELVDYVKLGRRDAKEAGVPEEIAAQLPLVSESLPLVPSEIEEASVSRRLQSRKRIASWAGCWRATWRRGAGTWPYHRDIYQETTWCTTIYNTVGSYSGRSWPHTGYGCSPNYGPTYQRTGGGVGYSSVDIETRGGFNCNVYWYGIQTWLWMVPRYYGDGRTAMAGWGE